ncbi:MAG: hypothetical protein QF666_16700 [Alphaproteobacteria bacterium]|jgi:hypothetical protein|nr:hypothetical protein [Alphaproteobacteria bacterium]|tara:strand:+ start:54 stop:314 length:261 start_codon:yes stop_codon:yes gene_type:complete
MGNSFSSPTHRLLATGLSFWPSARVFRTGLFRQQERERPNDVNATWLANALIAAPATDINIGTPTKRCLVAGIERIALQRFHLPYT